jgi:hypothetical protein
MRRRALAAFLYAQQLTFRSEGHLPYMLFLTRGDIAMKKIFQ